MSDKTHLHDDKLGQRLTNILKYWLEKVNQAVKSKEHLVKTKKNPQADGKLKWKALGIYIN